MARPYQTKHAVLFSLPCAGATLKVALFVSGF